MSVHMQGFMCVNSLFLYNIYDKYQYILKPSYTE